MHTVYTVYNIYTPGNTTEQVAAWARYTNTKVIYSKTQAHFRHGVNENFMNLNVMEFQLL